MGCPSCQRAGCRALPSLHNKGSPGTLVQCLCVRHRLRVLRASWRAGGGAAAPHPDFPSGIKLGQGKALISAAGSSREVKPAGLASSACHLVNCSCSAFPRIRLLLMHTCFPTQKTPFPEHRHSFPAAGLSLVSTRLLKSNFLFQLQLIEHDGHNSKLLTAE